MGVELRLDGLQLRFPLADLGQIYLIDQLAHLLCHAVEAVSDVAQLIAGVHTDANREITGPQHTQPLHQMGQRSQECPGGKRNKQRTEQNHTDPGKRQYLDDILILPLDLL
ncbi:hypothetical protein D3C75_954200 [compost metagenome]